MKKNTKEYHLESVVLDSERLNIPVELRNVTSDIDVYEHLDKPYLTASLTIVDSHRIFEKADLLGGERISIRIKSTRKQSKAITNNFYIKKIIYDKKSNDNEQVLTFHLVEDIAFVSNLQNVNKSYTGKISDIIEKVSRDYLDVDFKITGEDKQNVKVIVPNLNPIETIKWLNQRATTIKGYPFYCFSTMAFKGIYMVDLGSMLEQPPLNPHIPYRYDSISASSKDEDTRRRVIKAYKFSHDAEDLSKVIGKGLIGAKYNFLDTFQDYSGQKSFDFDIVEDVVKPISDDGLLKDQPNFPFSSSYEVEGLPFNKFQSETISMIRSSGGYRESEELERTKTYGEAYETSDYKLEIISRAMDNMLKKSILTVVMPGLDFIDGDKHATIGNKIRVEIPQSQADVKKSTKKLDSKKSGNYIIYAVRHQFKKEKYDAVLTLVKMGNLRR